MVLKPPPPIPPARPPMTNGQRASIIKKKDNAMLNFLCSHKAEGIVFVLTCIGFVWVILYG